MFSLQGALSRWAGLQRYHSRQETLWHSRGFWGISGTCCKPGTASALRKKTNEHQSMLSPATHLATALHVFAGFGGGRQATRTLLKLPFINTFTQVILSIHNNFQYFTIGSGCAYIPTPFNMSACFSNMKGIKSQLSSQLEWWNSWLQNEDHNFLNKN